MDALQLWTIYENPKDYPGLFVARKFLISNGKSNATRHVLTHTTLIGIRALIPPYLYCIGRELNDDPCIIESWL